jgi:ubiquitin carboxyl-terminal hydrolase 34
MFANLELSERQAFFPLGFCFAFKDFDGNPTNTAIQQDAQEFLNIFFARLEELLKPTSQKHLLDSVFGGKTCSQLKCSNCGNIRNKLETFYTLSVTVKDRKGLIHSLQKMIESSIISDFKCENCS